MKMFYKGTPVNSLNIHHFEVDTNSATAQPSDLQMGVTAFAKGQKIIGTGKCFSFASYGGWATNLPIVIPDSVNIVQIGSTQYPIKMTVMFEGMKTHDFTVAQKIAEVIIDGIAYPITISVQNGMLDVVCDQMIDIELFYGKDEHI